MRFDRDKFIKLVQTGALSNDVRLGKRLAMDVVNCAFEVPLYILAKSGRDEFLCAAEILDFEYGLFDKALEEYPEWIKRYFKWKQNPYRTLRSKT